MEDPKNGYVVRAFPGRELPENYLNLVRSKWMRSYRYGNDYIKLTEPDSYFLAYSSYIINVLIRPDAVVRLALLVDDSDVALGFSVIERDILHYVHVHKDFRNCGIGRRLVPVEIKSFTHLTRIGMKLWPTKLPDAKFNPFQ